MINVLYHVLRFLVFPLQVLQVTNSTNGLKKDISLITKVKRTRYIV